MLRKITLDGVLVVVAFGVVLAYLISPREVAGLIWDTLNMAVTYWVES